jgi:hypothetical protein
VTKRRFTIHVKNEGRFSSKQLVCYIRVPSDILNCSYFGIRNINIIGVGRKVQTFPQEYMTHEVPRCGRGEYICYLELELEIRGDWST